MYTLGGPIVASINRRDLPWWQVFPTQSRPFKVAALNELPDPALAPGATIRLRGKPEAIRKVLRSEWHGHRHQFVYIVETSACNFEPYWFARQLEIQA